MDWQTLEREADRLCDEARGKFDENRPWKSDPAYRKAVGRYRDAARLAPPPERPRLWLLAVELAGLLEDHARVVKLVREAARGDLGDETREAMKDHWECSAWAETRGGYWKRRPFPEPPAAGSTTLLDRKTPLPGQLTLIPGED